MTPINHVRHGAQWFRCELLMRLLVLRVQQSLYFRIHIDGADVWHCQEALERTPLPTQKVVRKWWGRFRRTLFYFSVGMLWLRATLFLPRGESALGMKGFRSAQTKSMRASETLMVLAFCLGAGTNWLRTSRLVGRTNRYARACRIAQHVLLMPYNVPLPQDTQTPHTTPHPVLIITQDVQLQHATAKHVQSSSANDTSVKTHFCCYGDRGVGANHTQHTKLQAIQKQIESTSQKKKTHHTQHKKQNKSTSKEERQHSKEQNESTSKK